MSTAIQTPAETLHPETGAGLPARARPRIPAAVWVVAVLAALVHMFPVWRAQTTAPPGWNFTGNLTVSPDMVEYRSWSRLSQQTGIVVENKLTGERNKPHIPVLFYYAIGKISRWTGRPPEFVYAYAGAPLAFALTALLFVTVRTFLRSPHAVWWVFVSILVGGGLGGHLKLLSHLQAVHDSPLLKRLVLEPLAWPLFEDYRSHYAFITMFDTHFLVAWLLTTAALLALYFALRTASFWRSALAVFLFGLTTLLHFYEGVLFLMIAAGIALLCWRKGLLDRRALITVAACAASALGCLLWVAWLHSASGIPVPGWRAVNILLSTVLIAYPLAWGLIAWGLAGYWRTARLEECFLLGWTLGCVALTFSGPFYQFPDRGTMTLPIPIYIVAGAIYFARCARVTPRAALLAVLVMGATPVWMALKQWTHSGRFDPKATFMFTSAAHRDMVDLLNTRAAPNDILMAAPPDVLWLAPEFPGRHYSGHFALTLNYEAKLARMARFFESPPAEQADFLQRESVRFLYIDAENNPRRLERVPGLVLLASAPIGALFEFAGGVPHASR